MKFYTNSSDRVLKLIEIFKITKNLNTYCTLNCKNNEIFIQVMDDSHVCLLNISIKKDWFQEYEGNNEVISFNTSTIVKILSLYNPKCEIFFETTKDEDYLEIILKYKDKTEKMFNIPLIVIETDIFEPQEIYGSAEFTVKTKTFDKYISEMLLFGETMEMICYNDNIYMKSDGDEGKYKVKIPYEYFDDLSVVDNLKLKIKVPLKYLGVITKASCVFNSIFVKIEKDSPFVVIIQDLNQETGEELIKINYYVAPKVDDEDDEFNENYDEFEQEEEYENLENEII